jgi:hypothetical protein
MDYQLFCAADRVFFEMPERIDDHASRFAATRRPVPAGWQRSEQALWISMAPDGANLPPQGWKIHVSSTLEDVAEVVERVWDFCTARRVAFKFLRSLAAAELANCKGTPRAGSGKLITIYPADDAGLQEVLGALGERLEGFSGPYILSDLRVGRGPLYVRYAAFEEMYCAGDEGELVPALYAPGGVLVPDRRGPVFQVPEWVQVPDFLQSHLAARSAGGFGDFPYQVVRALHFSNGGGVYLAKHRETGAEVVLREARPHAAIDRSGADAVARLRDEQAALKRLAGLASVPALHGYHVVWEHHFLAEEYVGGRTLLEEILTRYPLVHARPTDEQLSEYRAWAMDISSKIERALDEVHARGLRFGDLHPSNVIVRPNGEIALVDFELAAEAQSRERPAFGAAGFLAPAQLRGVEVDRYALECLRLFLFLPLTELLLLDPSKARTLHDAARSSFATVPPLGPLLTKLHPQPDETARWFTGELSWPGLRDSLVAGIHAAATPDRHDRLFPGDPAQFATGGVGLACGASGVLLALQQVGADVPREYTDWLARAALRPAAARRIPAGLYDGLHGVAMVLDRLGRSGEARECLERAQAHAVPLGVSLFRGRAGIALNLLHFARRTGEAKLLEAAVQLGDELAAQFRAQTGLPRSATPRPGILYGMTGCALLFVRLFEETGIEAYLGLAEAALREDLSHCIQHENGGLYLRQAAKNLPAYLDDGSGGIALVLHQYLRHREDAELAGAVRSALKTCHSVFVQQPGLHQGRAGLLALLGLIGTPEDREAALSYVHRLGWHALSHQGNLVFPGAGLQRVSVDLATGSAGILIGLHAAWAGKGSIVAHLDIT